MTTSNVPEHYQNDCRFVKCTIAVNIDPCDALEEIPDDILRHECERRGYEVRKSTSNLKRREPWPIDGDDLYAMREDFLQRRIAETVVRLEMALPLSFKGLADDIARFKWSAL